LVGKNESGKTAILEALEKLGSVRPGREDFLETSYPRMNWSEYEEASTVDTAIETAWELDAEERAYLGELGGDPAAFPLKPLVITKDYDNEVKWISRLI
jgi:predicted ATP-dependent endonuclease of OLD family